MEYEKVKNDKKEEDSGWTISFCFIPIAISPTVETVINKGSDT